MTSWQERDPDPDSEPPHSRLRLTPRGVKVVVTVALLALLAVMAVVGGIEQGTL